MTDHLNTPKSDADEAIWEALARFLAGESTPTEAEEVRRWVAASPERARLVAGVDAAAGRTSYQEPVGLDTEGALAKVRARMHADGVVPITAARSLRSVPERAESTPVPLATPAVAKGAAWRRFAVGFAAAGLVLVAGTTWFLNRSSGGSPDQVYATNVGQQRSFVLPDGSEAVLGPSSKLVAVGTFASGERVVRLEGEGYFIVKHDASHPFRVEAQGTRITDVGTEFSVLADDARGVQVAVREGAVEVRKGADGAAVQLQRGDRAVLAPQAVAVVQRGAATDDDFAFTRGALVFRDAPIAEVVADVRRWYGVEIVPGTTAMAASHVTATFSNESRTEALNVIALALGAVVEMRGDSALLRPRILRAPH